MTTTLDTATPAPEPAAPKPDAGAKSHRSWVRPIVTYVAAAYLFVFIPLFVGIAACSEPAAKSGAGGGGEQSGAGGGGEQPAAVQVFELSDTLQELLLLPVPLAGAIITYWFATRPTDKHLDRVLDRLAQAATPPQPPATPPQPPATPPQPPATPPQPPND